MEGRYAVIENNPASVPVESIPLLGYRDFMTEVDRLIEPETAHCLHYFAVPEEKNFRFFCFIADDSDGKIYLLSHNQNKRPDLTLEALTAKHYAFHVFEREIHEETGIGFSGHPWLKPLRYPSRRYDPLQVMDHYPFYRIGGDELHEVGVGPIHAGVIEPGHFRFICNGEKVLHLEIQLGYQHRGVEKLFAAHESSLKNIILSENIAGDSAIGHTLCHVQLVESLSGRSVSNRLQLERCIALEMERIAVHIGDTAALCADIAYQFGQSVNEALRTIVINVLQEWCGNRFGKGLIRSGGTHYPMDSGIAEMLLSRLAEIEERYSQITLLIFSLPSVLSRFESTGRVTARQARLIGAVGMAARSSGIKRDIRRSHPFQAYRETGTQPVIFETGDVMARAMLRRDEVKESIRLIRHMISAARSQEGGSAPQTEPALSAGTLGISLTEGWRGEIVHCALTGHDGKILAYKVKDPSVHNWMALALAVRNQEISDFPLCNKSFNLSYCGHDL